VPGPNPTSREPDCSQRILRCARRVARVGAVVALGALTVGCGSRTASPEAATDAQPARPLASLATQAVALVPAQYLRAGDSASAGAGLGPSRQVLASLDSAIVAELDARGTARMWVMPEALTRSAKRNPAFTSDPHALSAETLRSGVRRTNPRLGEPLASQMRSLVALTDARFGLIPVELRFEPQPGGATRAMLRLVLIDARLAQIAWAGDVTSDVATPITSAAIVAGLARRVADLLVAP
jgi:hypothetical protein